MSGPEPHEVPRAVHLSPEANETLITIFHAGPCKTWSGDDVREKIAESRVMRMAQGYLMLAEEGYRPGAPSDGCGGIMMTDEELQDKDRLYLEAVIYACRFADADDKHEHHVGCSNWTTNRALIMCIEAARLLNAGTTGDAWAARLLKRALCELQEEQKRQAARRAA